MIIVPSRVGRLNKRELVNLLQVMGSASRVDLSKALGLSQPTTGKIVDQLIRSGIVEEAGEDKPSGGGMRAGRPARPLRLDRRHTRLLAIEVGVRKTRLAALPVGAGAEDQWDLVFATPNSARGWKAELRKAARALRSRKFRNVLVSLPGVVDESMGRVLFSPNLHWTEQIDLPAVIRGVWNSPVTLVQEERALALGHQVAEPDREGFLIIDFGDGVGGAVMVHGRLYQAPSPVSGELGHTPVFGNSRPCGCGGRGCLETLASSGGLLRSFAGNARRPRPSWRDLVAYVKQQGVPGWMGRTLDHAATVIAGALNTLGLRQVVICGSLLEFPPAVFEHLSRAIVTGSLWGRFGRIEVKAARRRRIAGLITIGLNSLICRDPWPA